MSVEGNVVDNAYIFLKGYHLMDAYNAAMTQDVFLEECQEEEIFRIEVRRMVFTFHF